MAFGRTLRCATSKRFHARVHARLWLAALTRFGAIGRHSMAPASARSAPSISATRRVLSWMPTRSSSSSMKLLSQSTIRRIFSRVTRRMPARRQRLTSPLCTAALLLRAQRSAADARPLSKQRSSTCRRRRFARCSPQPRSPQPRSPQPRSPQPPLCRLRGRSPAASAPLPPPPFAGSQEQLPVAAPPPAGAAKRARGKTATAAAKGTKPRTRKPRTKKPRASSTAPAPPPAPAPQQVRPSSLHLPTLTAPLSCIAL